MNENHYMTVVETNPLIPVQLLPINQNYLDLFGKSGNKRTIINKSSCGCSFDPT